MNSNITLLPLQPDDKALFIALSTNPTVMQHVYTPCTVAQATDLFIGRLQPWHSKSADWLSFTLLENSTGNKVGTIGLKIINHQAGEAEVGFMLLQSAQGKGYASEALLLLRNYAFGQLHLSKLVAICAAANMGSVKLLQKSGFTLEQRLYANTKINGVLVDDLLYGLHSVDINPAKGS
jgi:[ribosomal protein S5]-alanine N-acetyltransferase